MTAAEAEKGAGRSPLTRGDGLILLAVVLAALALRLIYIAQYASSPTFDDPVMDSLYHVEWARAFARGESFPEGEPYFRAPLYPWFLGACFEVFGPGLLWPRIVQALLGASSAGLVFLIGRRLFGRVTGTAAGAVAASYWLFLYFDAELLIPPLIVFLDLAGLYLLVAADERPGPFRYGASGLVFGLSSIARPNILLFGPAAFLWILARNRGTGRGGAGCALLFALCWILPIAPVTVRNAVAGSDLVLISSQGGVNFYIGNNPRSDGTRAVVPGTRPDWWGGYRDAAAMAEREEGRKLKPSAVSRHFYEKALAWIASDPAGWLELAGRKARFFFNGREIGNNQPIRFFAERFAPIVRLLPVGFGAIAPLALLGFLLCFRRPGRLFPLWGFAAIYSVTVILFFVCTRYRIPVTAVLVIMACEAARWILSGLASPRRRARSAGAALLLAPLFVWVNTPPEGVVNPDFQAYRILGGGKLEKGDAGGAIRDFEKGLALRAEYAPLRVDLGRALVAKGKKAGDPEERKELLSRAEREFERALSSKDRDAAAARPAALFWLGVIATARKDGERAARFFEECLRLDPGCAEACRSLGVIHARKGELDAALALLKRAVELSPGLAGARVDLGKVLALRGDAAAGAAEIEEALRLDPDDVPARTFLADLLARLGRRGDAARALREALARTPPGSAEARRIAARLDRLEEEGK